MRVSFEFLCHTELILEPKIKTLIFRLSPDFNSMMRQMIETEFNSLRTSCAQEGVGQTRPSSLPEIISLYLMQYHGIQR